MGGDNRHDESDDAIADLFGEPPPVPDITTEQIAAAIERAVEIARQAAHAPDRLEAHPLLPADAADWTRRLRAADWYDTRMGMRRHAPGNWCRVGYVEEPRTDGHWDVWMCPDTGRVWLRAWMQPWRLSRYWPPWSDPAYH